LEEILVSDMKIVIIVETLPPHASSASVQMFDLAKEFVNQKFSVTVLVAAPHLNKRFYIENIDGVEVVHLKTLVTKDIGYIRRAMSEFYMSYAMIRNLKKTKYNNYKWDFLIWYSPTIFHGPLVKFLKKTNNIKSYLIIRDIFPEWALDIGILNRGLQYSFLKMIANYQYSAANTIGIQTIGNRLYFDNWLKDNPSRKLEVLNNWLGEKKIKECNIQIKDTALAGRKIFIYAGNMGIAQDLQILGKLAISLKNRHDIGFLFVGRGTHAYELQKIKLDNNLENMLIYNEINPDEISGLLAQCHIGLLSLDARHNTHNIPGKFLSYIQAGLPVLAAVNSGNDMVDLIRNHNVGAVITNESSDTLSKAAEDLFKEINQDTDINLRCKELFKDSFSSKNAVDQIKQQIPKYSIQ